MLFFGFLVGCGLSVAKPIGGVEEDVADSVDEPAPDVDSDSGQVEPPCAPEGTAVCPIPVPSTPYFDSGDTRASASDNIDRYACAPETDESGPELIYRIDVPVDGVLAVEVESAAGVDVDVHLLSAPDGDACLSRGHLRAAWFVSAGSWYVSADTWVDEAGVAWPGAFELLVNFLALGQGPCAMPRTDLSMYWSTCEPGLDCDDSGARPVLHTPSIGPTVLEAHLVTEAESFGGGWPTSFTDRIQRHYEVSEAASGWPMNRDQPWAPAGEGGSEFGQAAYGAPLPVEDEAWYVNMYWRDRPSPGTRMILINPYTGAAVVAAGGYETGPGDATRIGGASEEVHDALATDHLDPILFGFAADQSLSLGPIACW